MTENENLSVVRFLIALANVDGHFSKQEKAVVKEKLAFMRLSENQKSIITHDVYYPKNPIEIFKKITDTTAQWHCLYLGRILIFSDRANSDEKALLAELRSQHKKSLDVPDAYEEIKKTVREIKKANQLQSEISQMHHELNFWRTIYLVHNL